MAHFLISLKLIINAVIFHVITVKLLWNSLYCIKHSGKKWLDLWTAVKNQKQ